MPFLKSLRLPSAVCLLSLLMTVGTAAFQDSPTETGVFSIFFNEEKVGYEEYTWTENEAGYVLSVQGRMDSPIPILIRRLIIRLDTSFIPQGFTLEGDIGGMAQEISSVITDGRAENTIRVAGQDQQRIVQIKRDALLLPNPVYSAYMVLTKKYGCQVLEPKELSAYIIPQMEIPFNLSPDEEESCVYLLQMGQAETRIKTDGGGRLISLEIPSQRIKVVRQ